MLFRPPKQDFYNIKNVKDVATDMEDFSLIQPTSWGNKGKKQKWKEKYIYIFKSTITILFMTQCEGYQVWNSLSKDVENIGELN